MDQLCSGCAATQAQVLRRRDHSKHLTMNRIHLKRPVGASKNAVRTLLAAESRFLQDALKRTQAAAKNNATDMTLLHMHGLHDRKNLNTRTLLRRTRKLQGDNESESKVSGHQQASTKLDKSLKRDLKRRATTWLAIDKARAQHCQ
ncbi:hypothetical protein MTO96_007195 [Rhipicephalus appendiculatus]